MFSYLPIHKLCNITKDVQRQFLLLIVLIGLIKTYVSVKTRMQLLYDYRAIARSRAMFIDHEVGVDLEFILLC